MTGPEIQQLSMHGVVVRTGRCWCCGLPRHVRIERKISTKNSILKEYCNISSDIDYEQLYKHSCRCNVLEWESEDFVKTLHMYCIAPCTKIGNCNGRGRSDTTLDEFYKMYNNLEDYDVDESVIKLLDDIHNCIINHTFLLQNA